MRSRALLLLALVLGAAPAVAGQKAPATSAVRAADAPPFERVSATRAGEEPNDTSWDAATSADGRFVAFASAASNITSKGAAGFRVFLLDRRTHRVRVVSRHADGREGLGDFPALSADGRFVAFCTGDALVPGDSIPQLPLHDNYALEQPNDVYLYDVARRTTTAVSVTRARRPANYHSCAPSISADGRFVSFSSESPRIVPGDTNQKADVFVYDRVKRTVVRASLSSGGVQGDGPSVAPGISGNGRFVAFCSGSGALVPGGPVHGWDLYVRDLVARRTTRAGPGSCFEHPALSRDGRVIAYLTTAPQFEPGVEAWAQPVLIERVTGRMQLAAPSPLPSHGHHISLSLDGRLVAFAADVPQVEPTRPGGITDVFVFDSATGSISRTSTYPGASLAFADSERPALSGDGRWIVFDSTAQLLPGAHEPHRQVVYLRRLR
jgi:Tol biopolymer transport system component